jgi:tellurite methyltransferase
MPTPDSVEFFETQFRRQVREADFALNPFEQLVLPYVAGNVLDLGCSLGNLSLEAARRGCSVTAIDASPTAVERVRASGCRCRRYRPTWVVSGLNRTTTPSSPSDC